MHFNPRSPHGERHSFTGGADGSQSNFNPRSPHGERHVSPDGFMAGVAHFNPRSPHGERHGHDPAERRNCHISIHAPRTGSDTIQMFIGFARQRFQSTLPARGATPNKSQTLTLQTPFQSTLPARGATRISGSWSAAGGSDFNPRSPHGERLPPRQSPRARRHFNPRSPHGERHDVGADVPLADTVFNPRSPHGERHA